MPAIFLNKKPLPLSGRGLGRTTTSYLRFDYFFLYPHSLPILGLY